MRLGRAYAALAATRACARSVGTTSATATACAAQAYGLSQKAKIGFTAGLRERPREVSVCQICLASSGFRSTAHDCGATLRPPRPASRRRREEVRRATTIRLQRFRPQDAHQSSRTSQLHAHEHHELWISHFRTNRHPGWKNAVFTPTGRGQRKDLGREAPKQGREAPEKLGVSVELGMFSSPDRHRRLKQGRHDPQSVSPSAVFVILFTVKYP
jgi:hypothetical protein